MTDLSADVAALADKSLLVLDDDAPLAHPPGPRAGAAGLRADPGRVASPRRWPRCSSHAPAFAVLDMRLEDGTGLKVVEAVRDARPDAKIIMLTGYGNIATAVQAVKAGAVDYLSKPADADDVARALLARAGDCARRRRTTR